MGAVFTYGKSVDGAQAGFANVAERLHGRQVGGGAIALAELTGVQIGAS